MTFIDPIIQHLGFYPLDNNQFRFYFYPMDQTYGMMENIIAFDKSGISINKNLRLPFNGNQASPEKYITNPVIDNLIAVGGECFLLYLRSLGLEYERNIMVLSSKHNYYYDHKDIKGVKTLINLEKLNRIKHLESFLSIVCHYLSPSTNFIGCFFDKGFQNRMKSPPCNSKRFINFSDRGKVSEIGKKEVSYLLASNGLKVMDMTEINGLTYFSSRSIERSSE